MRRLVVIWIPVFLLLSGCASTVGREFDASFIESITRGVTTKAEIREGLGEPQSVTQDGQQEIWQYQFVKVAGFLGSYKYLTGGTTHETELLSVTFDGNIVSDFTYTKSAQ